MARSTIGEIATVITAKTAPFTRGMSRAKNDAKGFSKTIKGRVNNSLRSLGRTLTSTKSMILGLGTAIGAAGLVRKSVQLAAEAESMRVSYATFLKSMDKAKETLKELDKYSAATPFQSRDVKEAGKQLLAFGFEAEKLMDYITVIGNLAAGSQKPLGDFVDILGKVRASGRASMADVNRMADRGVPIYKNLAQAMGVAQDSVRDLVSTGKVGFSEMWVAVRKATEEGGLFAGAVENLSKTTLGKLSTLRDNIDKMFRDVGKEILLGLDVKAMTDQLTDLAKTYKHDIAMATETAIKNLVAGVKQATKFLSTLGEGWQKLKLAGKYVDLYTDIGATHKERQHIRDEIARMRRQSQVGASRRASSELSAQTDVRAAQIQRLWAMQERRENLPANRDARERMLRTGSEGASRRAQRQAEKAAKQRQKMIEEQRKAREAYLEGHRAQQMQQMVIGRF